MDRPGSPKPNAQILEEASTWFVELSEGEASASAREEFTVWLRTSPEHIRAFLQISAVWEDSSLLGRRAPADIEALLTRARRESNIVPLGATATSQTVEEPPTSSPRGALRSAGWAVAAGILAAAVGVGLWARWHQGMYSTGIGETRWVNLADGSTIELNAESRVHVRLSRGERDVDLLQGQALFRVTRNAGRPFVVHSGPAQITDVGTEFDVYHRYRDTVVTVIEGRVAVRAAQGAAALPSALPAGEPPLSGVVITAGEQVDLTPQAPPQPTRADVSAATAWTRQTLVFASAPLSEVVAQYNIYHEKRLVIQDPSLTRYHVSGVFSATDSSALVAFLRAQPTLAVREGSEEIDISSR